MKRTHLPFVSFVLCTVVLFLTYIGSLEAFSNEYSKDYVAPTETFPVVLYSAPNYQGEAFQLRVGKHKFKDVFPADIPRPDHKRWIRSIQMLPGATFEYQNVIGGIQDARYTTNKPNIKFRLDNLMTRNRKTDTVLVTYTKQIASDSDIVQTESDYPLDGLWYYGNYMIKMNEDNSSGAIGSNMMNIGIYDDIFGSSFAMGDYAEIVRVGINKYIVKFKNRFDTLDMTVVSPNRIIFKSDRFDTIRVWMWEKFTKPIEFSIEGTWFSDENYTYSFRDGKMRLKQNTNLDDTYYPLDGQAEYIKTGLNHYKVINKHITYYFRLVTPYTALGYVDRGIQSNGRPDAFRLYSDNLSQESQNIFGSF